jgi:hypothetical protein
MNEPRDTTRPVRLVGSEEAPAAQVVPVLTRNSVVAIIDLIAGLPNWGKVFVLTGAGAGLFSGVGVATVGKFLGVQTVTAAAADKKEVLEKIGGAVKEMQAANEVDAKNHAQVLLLFAEGKKASELQAANLQTLRRQISKRISIPPPAPIPLPAPPKEGPPP